MKKLLFVWDNSCHFSPAVESLSQTVRQHPTLGARWEVDDYDIGVHHSEEGRERPEQVSSGLLDHIHKTKPDVLGFSCWSWNLDDYLRYIRQVKKLFPHLIILLGGGGASSVRLSTAIIKDHPEIDVIVRGEGELVLCELLERIDQGRPWDGARGTTHRSFQGDAVAEPPQELITDMEQLPRIFGPGLFDEEKAKKIRSRFGYLELCMETSRGCSQRCGFCRYNLVGRRIQMFSLERMDEQIRELCQISSDAIRVFDSHFGINKERALSLLRLFARYNAKAQRKIAIFPNLGHIDEEYIALMKKIHVTRFTIGIQTTNPEALRIAERNLNWNNFLRASRLLKMAYPHNTGVDIMIGIPGDTYTTMKKSMDDVYSTYIPRIGLRHMHLVPDTRFYEEQEKYGFKTGPKGIVLATRTFPEEDIRRAQHLQEMQITLFYYLEGTLYFITENLGFTFTGLIDALCLDEGTRETMDRLKLTITIDNIIIPSLTSREFFDMITPFLAKNFSRVGRTDLIPVMNDILKLLAEQYLLHESPASPIPAKTVENMNEPPQTILLDSNYRLATTEYDVSQFFYNWIYSQSSLCPETPSLQKTHHLVYRGKNGDVKFCRISEQSFKLLKEG
ncbi:MAG TPA: radical SAM protein [Elusimicrobiota bacterium]|nr:radical SAM protein [Elusimicrobiota bacterium]